MKKLFLFFAINLCLTACGTQPSAPHEEQESNLQSQICTSQLSSCMNICINGASGTGLLRCEDRCYGNYHDCMNSIGSDNPAQ